MASNEKVNQQIAAVVQGILGERIVAYSAGISKAVGSVTAGVLCSQLVYWQPRTQNPEGWFWKTQQEIYDETGLTRFEQESARKVLKRFGIIEEKLMGVPARMHFRVDLVRLGHVVAGQFDGNPQPSLRKTSKLVRGKSADKNEGFPQTITETTAEITSIKLAAFDSSDQETRENDHGIDQKQWSPDSPQHHLAELLVSGEQHAPTRPPRSTTPELDTSIDAVSVELGEGHKASSNRSRARRELVDLPDAVAAAYIRRALAKTRAHLRDTGGVSKRMPYFFAVLDQLRAEAAAPRATTDLAGKYAAKVMR